MQAPPSYETICQWLIDELAKYGEVEADQDGDIHYYASGLLDSMSTLKFIVKVQKVFAVQFTPEQIIKGRLDSVYTLAHAIDQQLQGC
ncbi:phosphopantetheine-binding protein [Halioxenophilus sp. WMMB6]|uniref:phosphopantetheine-binding protein n=1 Tax=Halioxenophilus sp. WMMB6 TaxID=3073815 RepID=UPI00295E94E6|nr:phosphopantetheine-binding protein [Halioxenophilus sp. WMMB6]